MGENPPKVSWLVRIASDSAAHPNECGDSVPRSEEMGYRISVPSRKFLTQKNHFGNRAETLQEAFSLLNLVDVDPMIG